MFTNIGRKIKTLASVICWVGIIISAIGFIVMLILGIDDYDGLLIGLSFAVLIVGGLGSWIGSFILYGYGELIDRMTSIDEKISGKDKQVGVKRVEEKPLINSEIEQKLAKLEELRKDGLITEEEYNKTYQKLKNE